MPELPRPAAALGTAPLLLSDLLPGDRFAAARESIVSTGLVRSGKRELRVRTRPTEADHEVLAIAAVVRVPDPSSTYVQQVVDFQTFRGNRATRVDLYWNVYYNEGLPNNAINKIAAVMSSGGSFKVRRARRGKSRRAIEDLMQILEFFQRNVNADAADAVVTGSRGLKALTQQGARQALVEGSWLGRTVWVPTQVDTLGRFDLPMTIQSLSTGNVDLHPDVKELGIELLVWKPTGTVLTAIQKAQGSGGDAKVKKLIRKYFPRQALRELVDTRQLILEPDLTLHIKHRGSDREPFGESLLQPAMSAIAFYRSLTNLDTVTMQSIINRITLVMIGSDDPNSPFSNNDTIQQRTELMQSFFEDPGPNMTIIWAGKDVTVEDIGSQTAVLDLNDRYRIAIDMMKMALGVPDSLLSGTTTEGKSAGWAALLGLGAQFEELQSNFARCWTTIGERIALENGFTDVEVIYEFDHNAFADQEQRASQTRSDYTAGLLSIATTLRSRGIDPQAEFFLRCTEAGLNPETTSWTEVFSPPQGLQGQGEGKVPGEGRTPNQDTGKTTPERDAGPTPVENK